MSLPPLASQLVTAASFASSVATLLQQGVAAVLGAHAGQAAIGMVTWGALAAALSLAALTLLLSLGLAAVTLWHRPRAAQQSGMRARVVRAVAGPLQLLIWIGGAYLAVTPLLAALPPSAVLMSTLRVGDLAAAAAAFVALLWLIVRFTAELDAQLARLAQRTAGQLDDLLLALLGRSLRIMLPALAVILALPMLGLPARAALDRISSIVLIGALAAVLFQAVRVSERVLLQHFDIRARDNLRARTVYTQVRVISRICDVLIALFAVASVLVLFPEVRHVGTTLLASAGIAGIVAGFAAQRTLANLVAGLQVAFTQPIRQDDVVIVAGEWGRIEEITLTYVVVHIWDDRRLIVPLSHFIEQPFQNWTHRSAELLGSVLFAVDYTFPVEEGRRALQQIIEASPRWDRRFWNVQVTDCDNRTMQLRVLATASDSSNSWDLRCEIREKFIAFLQHNHPQALPRLRAQMTPAGAAAGNSPLPM